MKTHEIKESVILQAHNEACSKWKKIIEEQVPELFEKKLEVGKWYYTKLGKLVCITELKRHKFYCFGFVNYGDWSDNDWFSNGSIEREATREEVEEALIKEAKKRGFDKINKLNLILIGGRKHPKGTFLTGSNKLAYYNGVLLLSGVTIFKNGKWAEIIEEPIKEMTIEEIQKELGCKIKIVE